MKHRRAKLRTILILKLYAKGFDIKRIAYELNISEQTVRLRLTERGIDWRDYNIDKDRIHNIILDLEEEFNIVSSYSFKSRSGIELGKSRDPWNTSNWR